MDKPSTESWPSQPNQETIADGFKKKIDFLYGLKGKTGELYEKMHNFSERLRAKYPEEKLRDYFLYHAMVKSGVRKGEICRGDNPALINDIELFVDDLYREYGGKE